jgi:hypothetical protein
VKDFNALVGNLMLGIGVLMTIGLLFIFRALIRQVRAESKTETPKSESDRPSELDSQK